MAATPGPSTTVSDRDLPPLFQVCDEKAVTHQGESFKVVRMQLVVLLLATATASLAERVGSRVPSAFQEIFCTRVVLVVPQPWLADPLAW